MFKKPWKKNLLIIPPHILDKAHALETGECVVACLRSISIADIQEGLYAHLGITWSDEQGPQFPEQIVPPREAGRYSTYNRDGRVITHKDLPKIDKSWSFDTPNYGDSSKGYHEVTFTKPVYQRDFDPPKLLAICIEAVGKDFQSEVYHFKFVVDEVLDQTTPDFEKQLLFNLNLLQENVGNHDVFGSTTSREEYLNTLYVNWEILPPGEREEIFERILGRPSRHSTEIRQQLKDRYEFLLFLKPTNFIKGTSGFRNYFGALFADDLVVFENLEYGNAIYVMYEDWQELSQKSRTELLSSSHDFDRVLHTTKWKARLRDIVVEQKRNRGIID